MRRLRSRGLRRLRWTGLGFGSRLRRRRRHRGVVRVKSLVGVTLTVLLNGCPPSAPPAEVVPPSQVCVIGDSIASGDGPQPVERPWPVLNGWTNLSVEATSYVASDVTVAYQVPTVGEIAARSGADCRVVILAAGVNDLLMMPAAEAAQAALATAVTAHDRWPDAKIVVTTLLPYNWRGVQEPLLSWRPTLDARRLEYRAILLSWAGVRWLAVVDVEDTLGSPRSRRASIRGDYTHLPTAGHVAFAASIRTYIERIEPRGVVGTRMFTIR
jgi:lysophospholipase L1-like esterase